MRRLFNLLVPAILLLCHPTLALGQTIDDAIDLENQGLLVDALDAFEELLFSQGNSRDDLVTIFSHLTVLRFASGDPAGAEDAMMRMLALAPDAELPESAPPELQDIFNDSVDRWNGRRLQARVTARDDGEEVLVEVRATNDLMDMVAGVQLLADGDVIAESEEGPEFELRLPSEDAADRRLEVSLVNGSGGRLYLEEVQLRSSGGRAPRRDPDHGDEPRRGSRPRWHRVVAGVMLGVGLAATTGGAIALGFHDTFTGETRITGNFEEGQFRNTAAGGGLAVGLGGATAIAGAIWLILARRSGGGDESGEEEADRR